MGEFSGKPDDWLADRFKATGNEKYFAEIWRRHARMVYSRCREVVGGQAAEDLLQETFMMASSRIRQFRGNLPAWLCAIARRRCLNHLRNSIVRHEDCQLEAAPESECEPRFDEESLRSEAMQQALAQMSPPQRMCVKLYMQGYSYDEIARIAGCDRGAVKSHLQNGLGRLRRKAKAAGA